MEDTKRMAFDTRTNNVVVGGPYDGEIESGYDFFTGEPLQPEGKLISRVFTCSRCGRPQDVHRDDQTKDYICDDCRDSAVPKRRQW